MKRIRMLNLVGVALGVAIFALGAVMLSALALVGIVLAAVAAVAFTWDSAGRTATVRGLGSGLLGAVIAWVAMRSMMRWVALSSGVAPTLTLGGTLAILGTSAALSMLPAMGYIHFRRWLGQSYRAAIAYGLVLSAIGGFPMVLLLSGEIVSIAKEPLIPVSFLILVPVGYAITLEFSHQVLLGR